MSNQTLDFGKVGEDKAVTFLQKNGYKILARNFKTKLGEIDIIAKDNSTYCFIEVKTRHSEKFGLPFEAITKSKQDKLAKLALFFLKTNNLLGKSARFDIVSILCSGNGKCKTELLKNAFESEARYAF